MKKIKKPRIKTLEYAKDGKSYSAYQVVWSVDGKRQRKQLPDLASARLFASEIHAGLREGRNVFKNNDIVGLREVSDVELVLHDGRRMRRDGARIDQGFCITSHASQCRTVDQVVVVPDGADAKGWYVSLSRAREAMHVYTRNKLDLHQSIMQPGERRSVWELLQALQRSKPQSRDRIGHNPCVTRQAKIDRDMEMER